MVNPENLYTIMKNVELRKSDTYQEAVQVMPQHTSLKLRVNEAFNMDFYYEQAVDYPVDLYYLVRYNITLFKHISTFYFLDGPVEVYGG